MSCLHLETVNLKPHVPAPHLSLSSLRLGCAVTENQSHLPERIIMVNVYIAYTEPINPSGATPVLSRDQIWRGLQRKIRKAQDFVPVIDGTTVLEEKENEVTRLAHFKGSNGTPEREVKEVCKSYYPTKVHLAHLHAH